MASNASSRFTKEFVILGPVFSREHRVLEAIHALYFLPENFKMIFVGAMPTDRALINEATALLKRNALAHRVRFHKRPRASHAVVVAHELADSIKNAVSGDSPEAIASAVLNIARSTPA